MFQFSILLHKKGADYEIQEQHTSPVHSRKYSPLPGVLEMRGKLPEPGIRKNRFSGTQAHKSQAS